MRQRIGPGRSGQVRRQAHRQRGIQNHQFGQHLRIEEHRLAMSGIEGDHRAAPHLTASARGGGDGHQRQQATPVRLLVELRKIVAGAKRQQTRGLTGIQGASTANGDHAVALVISQRGGRLAHIFLDRIGMNPIKDEPLLTLIVGTEYRSELGECIGLHQSPIGDHERTVHTKFN